MRVKELLGERDVHILGAVEIIRWAWSCDVVPPNPNPAPPRNSTEGADAEKIDGGGGGEEDESAPIMSLAASACARQLLCRGMRMGDDVGVDGSDTVDIAPCVAAPRDCRATVSACACPGEEDGDIADEDKDALWLTECLRAWQGRPCCSMCANGNDPAPDDGPPTPWRW